MKVKTKVADLIARLEDYKRRQRAEYEQARDAYPAREEAYRAKVIAALERDLARVKRGGKPPGSHRGYRGSRQLEGVFVNVGAMPPRKPQPPYVKAINQRIAELRLCSTEDLVIDPSSRDWVGLIHGRR